MTRNLKQLSLNVLASAISEKTAVVDNLVAQVVASYASSIDDKAIQDLIVDTAHEHNSRFTLIMAARELLDEHVSLRPIGMNDDDWQTFVYADTILGEADSVN